MKKRVVHERGKNISYIESVFYSLITKTTVYIRNKEQYYSSVNRRGINQWQFSKTMCNLNCFCKNLNVIQKGRNGYHITTNYSKANSVICENAT